MDHNTLNDQYQYTDKWYLDPATLVDAANDERAFLKQFPVERRRRVAVLFWEPICMRGMFTPKGLLDFICERQKPWQQHYNAGRYSESDKAFFDQLYHAVHCDPMAVAYAAYMLEYVAHTMLPYLLSFHAQIKRQLPPTKAQQTEFAELKLSGIMGYDRQTIEDKIAKSKADYARWEREERGQ